jgi:hypothetical protein
MLEIECVEQQQQKTITIFYTRYITIVEVDLMHYALVGT